jgi:UDP-2-acetamido-2,6-beta-L-arabino-hexul-4-ose reductase
MIKVGITGQPGFVGTHLFNTLGLFPQKFVRIPFEDNFFQSQDKLETFIKGCDVIVHLAAVNRHNEPDFIYQTNIGLVNQLIAAMEKTNSTPHVLFSSSTQEERDNIYGKSKREGRELLEKWALRNNARFTGLVIPNVFGPFGNPYYNSVVATFCHQLSHNETPKIEIDGEIKLIYVAELVQEILKCIGLMQTIPAGKAHVEEVKVPYTSQIKVSELLAVLKKMNSDYSGKGEIPDISDPFMRNLFITYLTYIDHSAFFPFKLKLNTDQRGSFVETVKLNSGGQISFSTTVPGVTRGNHFHTRKAERFAVIKGKALIELRRIGTDKILSFELDGNEPSFVDMPVWYTHNIKNTGDEELYTIFWINEHFNPDDADTFFETV